MSEESWLCHGCKKPMTVKPDGSSNSSNLMRQDGNGDPLMVCPHCGARHWYTEEKRGKHKYGLKKEQKPKETR